MADRMMVDGQARRARNPRVAPFDLEGLVRGSEERAAYDALDDKFELVVGLLQLRYDADLTQAQLARRMSVTQSRIAQIESLGSVTLPSLTTIRRYAAACGQRLVIGFEPLAKAERAKKPRLRKVAKIGPPL